jgi:hypothetical protein
VVQKGLYAFTRRSAGDGKRTVAKPVLEHSEARVIALILFLNLKPVGLGAALKEADIVGDRRSGLQKSRVVLIQATGLGVTILSATMSVETNALISVRGGEFHRREQAHTGVGDA